MEVAIFRAKYSFEFKLKVVKEYHEGKDGYKHLACIHGVKDERQVRNWDNFYREFGEEGLLRKRQNKKYSVRFKVNAIELYQTSELSYREIANTLGINTPSLIASWKHQYREAGIDELSKVKGRTHILPKKEEDKRK